jgi:hypothetical protein
VLALWASCSRPPSLTRCAALVRVLACQIFTPTMDARFPAAATISASGVPSAASLKSVRDTATPLSVPLASFPVVASPSVTSPPATVPLLPSSPSRRVPSLLSNALPAVVPSSPDVGVASMAAAAVGSLSTPSANALLPVAAMVRRPGWRSWPQWNADTFSCFQLPLVPRAGDAFGTAARSHMLSKLGELSGTSASLPPAPPSPYIGFVCRLTSELQESRLSQVRQWRPYVVLRVCDDVADVAVVRLLSLSLPQESAQHRIADLHARDARASWLMLACQAVCLDSSATAAPTVVRGLSAPCPVPAPLLTPLGVGLQVHAVLGEMESQGVSFDESMIRSFLACVMSRPVPTSSDLEMVLESMPRTASVWRRGVVRVFRHLIARVLAMCCGCAELRSGSMAPNALTFSMLCSAQAMVQSKRSVFSPLSRARTSIIGEDRSEDDFIPDAVASSGKTAAAVGIGGAHASVRDVLCGGRGGSCVTGAAAGDGGSLACLLACLLYFLTTTERIPDDGRPPLPPSGSAAGAGGAVDDVGIVMLRGRSQSAVAVVPSPGDKLHNSAAVYVCAVSPPLLCASSMSLCDARVLQSALESGVNRAAHDV